MTKGLNELLDDLRVVHDKRARYIIYSAITSMFLLSATNEQIIQGMEKCLSKIQNRAFAGLPPDLGRSQ